MSTPQPDTPNAPDAPDAPNAPNAPTTTTEAAETSDDNPARPGGPYVPYNPYPPHQPYFVIPEPPRKPRNPWVFVVAGLLLVVVGFPVYKIAGDYHHVYTRPPEYTLSTPKTLLYGDFRLVKTDGGTADRAMNGHRDEPLYYAGLHTTQLYYTRVLPAGSPQDMLYVAGFHGTVYEPDLVREQFAKEFTAVGATLAEPLRDITPPSGGDALTCGVEVMRQGARAGRPIPVCVWADRGTIGVVCDMNADSKSAGSVDLTTYAAEVAAVRDQMAVRLS
ncbi:hypothetical protein K7472_27840 [Streptomyces sp. PTM05]|uniref:Uncharacterized protein n=1 Tax=Streptantibioticus parmotrematis TaxID=2873249 RepID=A0ABS7QZH9_9ACTN|nr:hypothetical protein [Streptantibioticus parmotrematis]MBY8888626.1 hypothetical protein [Streptantibioticus parmotrematis]